MAKKPNPPKPAAKVSSAAPTPVKKAATVKPAPIATPPAPVAPVAKAAAANGKNPVTPKTAAPAKNAVKALPPKKTPKTAAPTTRQRLPISTEDIALRAYFIAEKRQAHGIHAEPHQDWLEAERQLTAERSATRRTRK
jgi:hypothetical protein